MVVQRLMQELRLEPFYPRLLRWHIRNDLKCIKLPIRLFVYNMMHERVELIHGEELGKITKEILVTQDRSRELSTSRCCNRHCTMDIEQERR